MFIHCILLIDEKKTVNTSIFESILSLQHFFHTCLKLLHSTVYVQTLPSRQRFLKVFHSLSLSHTHTHTYKHTHTQLLTPFLSLFLTQTHTDTHHCSLSFSLFLLSLSQSTVPAPTFSMPVTVPVSNQSQLQFSSNPSSALVTTSFYTSTLHTLHT